MEFLDAELPLIVDMKKSFLFLGAVLFYMAAVVVDEWIKTLLFTPWNAEDLQLLYAL